MLLGTLQVWLAGCCAWTGPRKVEHFAATPAVLQLLRLRKPSLPLCLGLLGAARLNAHESPQQGCVAVVKHRSGVRHRFSFLQPKMN